MRRLLLIFSAVVLILSFSSFSNSQNGEWKLHKVVDGIKIYTQQVSCEVRQGVSNNYLIFKYENTTAQQKEMTWRMDVYYNGVCRACDVKSPNAYEITLNLPPNSSKKGDCSSTSFAYKIFHSDDRGELAPLDKFEFTNLTIK